MTKEDLRWNQRLPEGDWRVWAIQHWRGWGGTTACNWAALEWAERHSGGRVVVVAPTRQAARDLNWVAVLRLVHKEREALGGSGLGSLRRRPSITLDNGSRICFMGDDEGFSMLDANTDLVVFDALDHHTNGDLWSQALDTTARIVATFSPMSTSSLTEEARFAADILYQNCSTDQNAALSPRAVAIIAVGNR